MVKYGIGARGKNLAESMESARKLEDLGFDWISVGDDAFVSAAAYATVTKRATLGSCVTLLTRTPVQAMQGCSSLDDLTGGRFVFGIGVGPNEWNRDWHSLDPARPARRMAEYIQCFKAAWNSRPGAPANVDGEIYSVHDYVRFRRSPSENLPVLVGVVGPKNTRNAARYGDGAIFDIVLDRRYVENVSMPNLLEGMKQAGKDRGQLTAGALLALNVDSDGAAARRRARHSILLHIPVHYYAPAFEYAGFAREAARSRDAYERGDIQGALDAITPEMVEALTICGTPDEARKTLREWENILDLLVFTPPSHRLPADEVARGYQQAVEFLAGEIADRGRS